MIKYSVYIVNNRNKKKKIKIKKNNGVTLGICTEISLHGRAYRANLFYNTWQSLTRQCK